MKRNNILTILIGLLLCLFPTEAVSQPTPEDSTSYRAHLSAVNIKDAVSLPLISQIYACLKANPSTKDSGQLTYSNVLDNNPNWAPTPMLWSVTTETSSDGSSYIYAPYLLGMNAISDMDHEYDSKRFPHRLSNAFLDQVRSFQRNNRHGAKQDKALLVRQTTAFDSLSHNKPLFFSTIYGKFGGDINAYVDYLYKRSFLTNRFRLNTFMRWPSAKKIEQDPGVQFILGLALYELWLKRGGEAVAAETRDGSDK